MDCDGSRLPTCGNLEPGETVITLSLQSAGEFWNVLIGKR